MDLPRAVLALVDGALHCPSEPRGPGPKPQPQGWDPDGTWALPARHPAEPSLGQGTGGIGASTAVHPHKWVKQTPQAFSPGVSSANRCPLQKGAGCTPPSPSGTPGPGRNESRVLATWNHHLRIPGPHEGHRGCPLHGETQGLATSEGGTVGGAPGTHFHPDAWDQLSRVARAPVWPRAGEGSVPGRGSGQGAQQGLRLARDWTP